jgi:hypothetical protein
LFRRPDKRQIFFFLSLFTLVFVAARMIRVPQKHIIKALLQVNSGDITNVSQPRAPKLSQQFFVNSVEFPLYQYLRYKDGTPIGFSDHFFLDLQATFSVTEPGTYTFFVRSDDGFRLFVDRDEVCSFPADRPQGENQGSIYLKKGLHTLWLNYFQRYGPASLEAYYQEPGDNTLYAIGRSASHTEFIEYP